MLRDEIELYTKLTGKDGAQVPIIKLGAFLDGYETGLNANKWVPVSERLPKKSGKYWCTFGGTYNVGVDSYCTKEDAEETYEEPEEYVGWASQNVIAWQPLPKPYAGMEAANEK